MARTTTNARFVICCHIQDFTTSTNPRVNFKHIFNLFPFVPPAFFHIHLAGDFYTMNALARLTVACAVLQLLSSCKDVVEIWSTVVRKKTLEHAGSNDATQVDLLMQQLVSSIGNLSINNHAAAATAPSNHVDIVTLANACRSPAQEIKLVMDKINAYEGKNLKKAFPTIGYAEDLERLVETVQQRQRTLQTYLLNDIW